VLEGGAHRLVALTEGFRAGFAGGALVAAAFNPARRLCRVLRVRRRPWEVQMAQLLVFGVDSPQTAS
jgi:hypothetical protein